MASDSTAYTTVLAGTSKAMMNRDIVTGTLDTLNSNWYAGDTKKSTTSTQAAISSTYDFNKSVLSATYGKGNIITFTG